MVYPANYFLLFLSLVPARVPSPFNRAHLTSVSNFSTEVVSKILNIPVPCLWRVCLWMCLLGDDASCDGVFLVKPPWWMTGWFSFLRIDTESSTFWSFLKEPHQALGSSGTWGPSKWSEFYRCFCFHGADSSTRPPCPLNLRREPGIYCCFPSSCWFCSVSASHVPAGVLSADWDCKVVLFYVCIFSFIYCYFFIFEFKRVACYCLKKKLLEMQRSTKEKVPNFFFFLVF